MIHLTKLSAKKAYLKQVNLLFNRFLKRPKKKSFIKTYEMT